MERVCEGGNPSNLPKTDDSFKLSAEESKALSEVFSDISAKQFKALRMDAAGVDTTTIATVVKISPKTVHFWRKEESYIKARNIFLSVINRQGLQFRMDCQKLIMGPAYAELIRKMNDGRILKSMDVKDLLNVIKTMGKENRLDMTVSGAGEEDDDLKEMMERRKSFDRAKQAQAVNELMDEDKIIQFPTGTDGN